QPERTMGRRVTSSGATARDARICLEARAAGAYNLEGRGPPPRQNSHAHRPHGRADRPQSQERTSRELPRMGGTGAACGDLLSIHQEAARTARQAGSVMLSIVRPPVADLIFRVYGRPLHPELFDVLAMRQIRHADFVLTVRITRTGHVISWEDDNVHLTEVTAAADQELPSKR